MKQIRQALLRVAFAMAVLVSLGGALMYTPTAQASLEECAGKNNNGGTPGAADCTKPKPGPWSRGYCPVYPPSIQKDTWMCSCSGGTYLGPYAGGCVGSHPPADDSEIVSQAACFSAFQACADTNVNFTGWNAIGSSTDDYAGLCAHYEAKKILNVEISNYSAMFPTGKVPNPTTGACDTPSQLITLVAAKSRPLICPLGFSARGRSDGTTECWRLPYCPTCNQQGGISPVGGGITISGGDYPVQGDSAQPAGSAAGAASFPGTGGGGAFPIQFSRTYSNTPFYATVDGADRGEYGFGVNWVSNYDMRVFTDPSNPGILATVQRQNGYAKTFDPSGNEIGVLIGNEKDHLTKLTNGSGQVTGYRYTTSTGDQVETYDADGKLLTISNRAGLTQTLTYSDASTPLTVAPGPGLLIKISDPFGRALTFKHNSSGYITQMTDPAGGLTDYVYDLNGNLSRVTYPDDGSGKRSSRQYLYNELGYAALAGYQTTPEMPNNLTGIVDENGVRYASFYYHEWGFANRREFAGGVDSMSLTFAGGNEFFRTFDATYLTGDPASPSQTTRRYTVTTVDGKNKAAGVIDTSTNQVAPCSDCGGIAARSYDSYGFLASTLDFNGNLTCYTNDARGLELKRVEGLTGATCPGTATASTRTTTSTWDSVFHLPLSVAEPLRITAYVYDSNGNLLTRTVTATSDTTGAQGLSATPMAGKAPRTWTYTYNTHGQVLTVNGPRTDVSDVTSYTYYSDTDTDLGKRGNVATITNALSQTTQITAYNLHGQPLTVVDPNGLTTQLTYDGRRRLIQRNVGGEITAYLYDDLGLLKQTTMPDGSSISYTYDDAHRLTAVQDNLGNRIAYTLDLKGNRIRELVTGSSGQLAQARSRAYDALNRLQKDIGAQSQTTQYAYDLQGNLTAVTDPLNRVTNNTYDALNRLATMTQPAPGAGQSRPVIGYAYNGLDQLTQVTDPRSLVTSYAYDGLGNMNQQVSPDTGTTANTYDAAGNILTSTDAKSQVTTYTYDAMNRVATLTYNNATGTQLKTLAYTYDQGTNGIGRLTTVTETAADGTTVLQTTQYAYDPKGRLTQETRALAGQNYVSTYTYNQTTGHLTGMSYPSGRTLAYSYDSLGRISQITSTASAAQGGQTQALVAGVTYQPFGGINGYILGNNQAVTRNYDQDGRISGYNLGATGYNVGYDQAGRIISLLNTGNVINSNSYGYDNLDRLIQATLPGNSSYSYAYDLTGNRTSKGYGTGPSDTYTMSSTSNQLAQVAGSSSRSFTYDANGSTTNDSNNLYTYDARGRMVAAQNAAGTTTYQVGANGQRVRKTGQVGDTIFVYDASGRLITEATAAGVVKKEYFYLLDLLVAVNVQ